MKTYITLILLYLLSACGQPDAQKIVDESIAFYNMDKLKDAELEFTFRDINFKIMKKDGRFQYERTFTDSTGKIHDVLNNSGFKRTLNGLELKLDKLDYDKYSESLNAVVYFLYLPLKLNDSPVIKKYLGESLIKGKSYYKIEISFDQGKGGADHNDVFYYWFDKEDYSMDHFAYSSGGNRFREVLRTHHVGGVIFQDYINYQMPLDDSVTTVDQYDRLFQEGKLRELSRIEFKDMVLR